MSWHFIGAALHWLYAHLASVGISAGVTAIGGAVMWFLGFRKAKLNNQKLALEIDHIKVDTKRLELEVERLTAEQGQREQSKKLSELSERILQYAKESIRLKRLAGAIALSEASLCAQLKESPEAVNKALRALADQRMTRHSPGGGGTWIFDL
jgi:hypothetical protein